MSAALRSERLSPHESRDIWDPFVAEAQGSLFCTTTWLDAVAPEAYEVCAVWSGERVVAGMPYLHKRVGPLSALRMPPLTPRLGVLVAPQGDVSEYRRSTNETLWLTHLVAALPKAQYASLTLQPEFENWLPFYWAGYGQTTRYTYMLTELSDLSVVFDGFARSKRKNIRRAEKLVRVRRGLSAGEMFSHHRASLAANGAVIRYSASLLERIQEALTPIGGWNTWHAVDTEGVVQSAILAVSDARTSTFLVSSLAPGSRETGCLSLLIWEAIQDAAARGLRFDFEGSMDPRVEDSFRRFGATRVPYYHIYRGLEWQRAARMLRSPARWIGRRRGQLGLEEPTAEGED